MNSSAENTTKNVTAADSKINKNQSDVSANIPSEENTTSTDALEGEAVMADESARTEELVEYDLTHENAPPCEEEFLGDNDSATSNFDDSHYAREDEAVQSTLSDAPHVGAAANDATVPDVPPEDSHEDSVRRPKETPAIETDAALTGDATETVDQNACAETAESCGADGGNVLLWTADLLSDDEADANNIGDGDVGDDNDNAIASADDVTDDITASDNGDPNGSKPRRPTTIGVGMLLERAPATPKADLPQVLEEEPVEVLEEGHTNEAANDSEIAADGTVLNPILPSSVVGPRVPAGLPSTKPWYVGGMHRHRCETAVAACMAGDFLIRRSQSTKCEILCVNDSGRIVNFSIPYTNEGKFEFVSSTFDLLDDVVSYLWEHPLKARNGGALRLSLPAILAPWYVGFMSRSKVEQRVTEAQQTGEFLVRRSASQAHDYVLCVNDHGNTASYTITRSDNRFTFSSENAASLEQ